ncbi:glycoside hydrolase family 1 protein [Spiroplasma turonicum]|uniref:6-phospho-beta-glucosidase n=1 Tax=Spiroplasma turonicum TaxID=216946 RepID=A0A0K1P690_9MOLU|nr:glycoside hydrolase family 1 protein [Spiroplasma turonicum]AKU79838.1 6-phospho-beta-glucosidase [Spiroplasma turonicum]ALX70854.1 6-phospho-beta-glucosidase [Spiroplasma turonicum]
MKKKFPDNFLWGASTSAYQFEGGYNADGKGMSIQDVRTNIPEGTSDFKVASDHYNKWKEDVKLLAELGLKSYRFSISWSRIIPDGVGKINEAGINFYNDLINELISFNITPIVTMYHFDLPHKLNINGGWLNYDTVNAFECYSKILFENFGDRVKYWLTINEQNIMILFGEIVGVNLPDNGNKVKSLYQVNHHMMVAQAKAINMCHKIIPDGKIGPAPNISSVYAETSSPIDNFASFNMRVMRNWFYLDTCVFGKYNSLVINYLKNKNSMFEYNDEDMNIIKNAKPDFIAFNYYASATAKMPRSDKDFDELPDQQKLKSVRNMYQQIKNDNLQKTEFGWEIDPLGFRNTLRELWDRYNLPLMITENGIGGYDKLNDDFKINDEYRIDYYKKHLEQLKLAILEDNINVFSYNPWSAFDLVSTHEGVKKRYGFIYVNRDEFDLKDLKRYKKDSFYWYKKIIETNGFEL